MNLFLRTPRRLRHSFKTLCAVGAAVLVSSAALGQGTPPSPPPRPPVPTRPAPRPATPPPTTPATSKPASRPESAPAKDLPAPKDIIDACIEAMGGKKKFEAIQSTMIKATMSSPMIGEMGMELYSAKPGKFLIKQKLPQNMGEISIGSDGKVGWMNNPMQGGVKLLDDNQSKKMEQQSTLYRIVLNMAEDCKDLQTIDRTDFNGESCYKLKMINEEGSEQFAYFSVDKKLIRAVQINQEGPMGPATTTVKFEDWKAKDDLNIFTKMNIEQGGMEMTLTFDEVEFNKADPAVFALPDEVKALIEKKENPPAGTQPGTGPATTKPATPGPSTRPGPATRTGPGTTKP